jgi:hypothetical protein
MSTQATPIPDEAMVREFVNRLGATVNAALVVIADNLGLYAAMAGAGPLTPGELVARTGTTERYAREWLNAQAVGGFVDYDAQAETYTLPSEKALVLARG